MSLGEQTKPLVNFCKRSIDLMTRFPVEIWFEENPKAADTKLEENILNLVTENTLLLLDRGFYHFNFWLKLIDKKLI